MMFFREHTSSPFPVLAMKAALRVEPVAHSHFTWRSACYFCKSKLNLKPPNHTNYWKAKNSNLSLPSLPCALSHILVVILKLQWCWCMSSSYSEAMHSSLQKCTQGRGRRHRWWSSSGFRPCWRPLLGFPAAGRGLCAWHRHHGEAHRQRPPHVVRGHHQGGGTGLFGVWDGVFQHSKMYKRERMALDQAGCCMDPTCALGSSFFLSLAGTRCHVPSVWPCWMWSREKIFREMPHVLADTWVIVCRRRNWSIRSSVTFGKDRNRATVWGPVQNVLLRSVWQSQDATVTESPSSCGSDTFASS